MTYFTSDEDRLLEMQRAAPTAKVSQAVKQLIAQAKTIQEILPKIDLQTKLLLDSRIAEVEKQYWEQRAKMFPPD
jgi:uncharacterized iron-regulated protein